MRKLVVALVVLLVLAAIADVVARRMAEERVARRLQRTFDLSSRPDVSIRGTPFILSFLRGEVSTVAMSANRVGSGAIRLDDVEVEMRDVRFSPSDVIDGTGEVHAAGGDGSASLGEASLNDALRGAGAPVTLSLEDDGVTASPRGSDVQARAEVTLDGDALAVGSAELTPVAFDLPSLGGRVSYDSVEVADGKATLYFTVAALRVGGRPGSQQERGYPSASGSSRTVTSSRTSELPSPAARIASSSPVRSVR